ncbi:L-2-hydroxyglutarate oxidase [Halorarum halophilum]|uniref:L-2-hydroxyglutarate oxidase n=1 Tax=Halorarum halophilum TaxID=2743090 RepID=A0A7D5GBC3_9EURY|nr:L-2-hydroxyglutarate oxidase [Halobaculum halophilum]QLG27245.1 L-2-hydroxyglutarate oxidase [Halobaculum halophilum]
MIEYDVAIVGGGCVGCSVAKHLAERSNLDVCILEKEYHLAEHQSGRNSGVLHPGFNYPPGSLKARFATAGTARLKEYARENGIPLREFGVVVVARDETEVARLDTLRAQADENGVETEIIGPDELAEREPHAEGVAALYCPEAASIDSQKYVYALATEVENLGIDFYLGHRVEKVRHGESGHVVETSGGSVSARYLVNAAGLYADRIAHQLGVGTEYQIVPFRGEYYELVPEKRYLCETMIYPTPDPELPFLGVHYTRRTDDKVIVGPNAVLAFGREAYRNTQFDLGEFAETLRYGGFRKLIASPKMIGVAWDELNKSYRKGKFVEASRRLVPDVREADFRRSFAGNRAQLVDEHGELVKDPLIERGPDSLHVLNIVSPGLTSSLPFGDYLAEQVLTDIDG